ncbi:MAG: hypothetical protein BroJett040_22890 [Oligoflexia bacterium]|nr:MAG: hypothetical protein BroJett040_22890 [Oligoflexia bacterium]
MCLAITFSLKALAVYHMMFMKKLTGGSAYSVTISSNVQNFNLRNTLMAAPYNWNGTTPISVQVTVNSGVYVWSDDTSIAAFDTGSIPVGSSLTIINNGYIMGKGGMGGGYENSCVGQSGGSAMNLTLSAVITSTTGYIAGGGGGGGGYIQSGTVYHGGGGGAGGGRGGLAYHASYPNSTPGQGGAIGLSGTNGTSDTGYNSGGGGGRILPGSTTTGPSPAIQGGYGGSAGGTGAAYFAGNTAGAGGGPGAQGGNGLVPTMGYASGGGGGWGSAGGSSYKNGSTLICSGGAGGKAINTNGNVVTWSGGSQPATVYGAVN